MASHHQKPADGSWPLEPGARYSGLDRDIVRGDPSAPPTENEAAISAAISLKRIADGVTELLMFLERHSWEGAIMTRETGAIR